MNLNPTRVTKKINGGNADFIFMSKQRREKISFTADKKVSKPVRVEFHTKEGERVAFKAHEKVSKPVKVEFYAKKKK